MKSSLSSIQKEIISNPKEINKINIICESLITDLQSKNQEKVEKTLSLLVTIFTHFLKSPKIKPSNELRNFLNSKIDIIFKLLFELSSIDLDIETAEIVFSSFNTVIPFKEQKENLYSSLVDNVIFSEEYIEHDIILLFIESFSNEFDKIFTSILKDKDSKLTNNNTIYNLYNFLIGVSSLDDDTLKEKYQNIMISLINNPLFPDDLVKNFLIYLNKNIINNVSNPLIFSDYLINKTSDFSNIKNIDDFDIKIFGLSSLFILLTKYKLDYDKYYTLLYELISLNVNSFTIFDSKYKNRLYKILELSLKSSSVPFNVICSFIKKLCRLSLFMKDSNIVTIITLVTLIIQSHPQTLHMLMYKRSKKEQKENVISNSEFNWEKFNSNLSKKNTKTPQENENEIDLGKESNTDMFKENETDPYKTNAQYCSLWELYTLKNHYNIKVRKVVNRLSNNFLPKQFVMEELKEKDMLFDIEKTNAHFYINA